MPESRPRQPPAWYRVALESIGDAVLATDGDGRVTFLNAVAERLTGWPAEDAAGRPAADVFRVVDERTRLPAEDPVRQVLASGATVALANGALLLARDGREVPVDDSAAPIPGEDGRVAGVVLVFRDVTARRASEEALRRREERFRALTQSATDAIVVADDSGRVTYLNQAASRLFGRAEEDVLGRPLTILMPERHREAHERGFERLRTTGEARLLGRTVELEALRADGSEVPIELSLSTWETEHGHFYCGFLRDVSDRRQLEQARLETAVLADVDRRKNELLAMLSHELRNPLAPIVNAVHLLKLRPDEDPVRQRAREIIDRQVGQLTRLVDDLLEVSRVVTGRIKLQRERGDLRRVVERALETTRPLREERRHALTADLPSRPVWVDGDLMRLEHAVVNLVHNAVKYTDPGGRIAVSLAEEDDVAVLRVTDDGIGIAPELLPRVFDLFTQAERSLDRAQGGLGVGLTVVRRVVELHGGTVEARSDGPGRGSEFVLRLPRAMEAAPQEASAGAAAHVPGPGALRILVVDDNRDATDSTALLLRQAGHEVRTAYGGDEAVETALAWQPDAVLLDLGLPEVDGFEVARRLRAEPELRLVRLVALTGHGQKVDVERTRAAGFDAHLLKPVDLRRLLEVLATVTR